LRIADGGRTGSAQLGNLFQETTDEGAEAAVDAPMGATAAEAAGIQYSLSTMAPTAIEEGRIGFDPHGVEAAIARALDLGGDHVVAARFDQPEWGTQQTRRDIR
jgi:hypothetical protein